MIYESDQLDFTEIINFTQHTVKKMKTSKD